MGSSHMGGGGGGGGMMGYQPGVHHDPNYHPHSGMHLRAPHPSMGMNPGMGGHHHNMMNGPAQPGYTRMSMMHGPHGGQMMPGMGGPHHPHQMMGMGGPAPPHRGMNPGMMYAGNRMPPMTGGGMGGGGMGGGGMVPRMLPNANPQPPSDGVQAVTALPNPSFYTESSTNNNPSVNPNYSTGTASQPQNQQMHPPTMNPQQTVAPPTMQQAPSPAPPKTVNVRTSIGEGIKLILMLLVYLFSPPICSPPRSLPPALSPCPLPVPHGTLTHPLMPCPVPINRHIPKPMPPC